MAATRYPTRWTTGRPNNWVRRFECDGAGSLDELVRTYYARPRSKRSGLLAAIKRTSPDVDRTWRDPEWEFASPVD